MKKEINIFLGKGCNAILSTSKYVQERYNILPHHDIQSDFANQNMNINNELIEAILKFKLTPTYVPILDSDHVNTPYNRNREQNLYYWMINPANNPLGYVNRSGEFAISLILMRDSKQLLTIISIPVEDKLYFGSPEKWLYIVEKCSELESNISISSLISIAKPIKILPIR